MTLLSSLLPIGIGICIHIRSHSFASILPLYIKHPLGGQLKVTLGGNSFTVVRPSLWAYSVVLMLAALDRPTMSLLHPL